MGVGGVRGDSKQVQGQCVASMTVSKGEGTLICPRGQDFHSFRICFKHRTQKEGMEF